MFVIEAETSESLSLNICFPIRLNTSPSTSDAIARLLRIYFAEDGFIINCSKSIIDTSTLNNTLNNILNDSSVPFVWYNDFDSFKKLPTFKVGVKLAFSNPGTKVFFISCKNSFKNNVLRFSTTEFSTWEEASVERNINSS